MPCPLDGSKVFKVQERDKAPHVNRDLKGGPVSSTEFNRAEPLSQFLCPTQTLSMLLPLMEDLAGDPLFYVY